MKRELGVAWVESGNIEKWLCDIDECEFFHLLQKKYGQDYFYPKEDKGKCEKCINFSKIEMERN